MCSNSLAGGVKERVPSEPSCRGLPPACLAWVDVVNLGSLDEEPPMASTVLADVGFPIRNKEGYADLTAYQVLKKAPRAEFGYRALIYICSPYSGDRQANTVLAREMCAHAVGEKKTPLAPHLLFLQFMNDADGDERKLAMFFNRILLSHCEAMWVYAPRVSPGTRIETAWAHALERPIRYLHAVGLYGGD